MNEAQITRVIFAWNNSPELLWHVEQEALGWQLLRWKARFMRIELI